MNLSPVQKAVVVYLGKFAGHFDEAAHPRVPSGSPTGGQFTATGGGGRGSPKKPTIERRPTILAEHVVTMRPDGVLVESDGKPIIVYTVTEALARLKHGQGVMFERPKEVVTLLERISMLVQEAKERGEKAPLYDLCKVYIANTNLFCSDSVQIKRINMPQLTGIPRPGTPADKLPRGRYGEVDLTKPFYDHLRSKGVEVEEVTIQADKMRAAQNEMDGWKVSQIVHTYEREGVPNSRVFVSKENYIVDGHHRWAAEVAIKIETHKSVDVPVYRADMPILKLLKEAIDFSTAQGVQTLAVGKDVRVFSHHCTGTECWIQKFDASEPRDERGRWTAIGGHSGGGETAVDHVVTHAPSAEDQHASAESLREYITQVANFQGDKLPEGWKSTPMALQRDYGQEFIADEKTYSGKKGPQGMCYMNAGRLALGSDDLTYVEGHVAVHGVPIEHAWVVDPRGHIIDPTIRGDVIKMKVGYFGVPIKTSYLNTTITRTGVWGIMDPMYNEKIYRDNPKDFVASVKVLKGEKGFDPSEPRDTHGRWTAGGGGGGTVVLERPATAATSEIQEVQITPAIAQKFNNKLHDQEASDVAKYGEEAARAHSVLGYLLQDADIFQTQIRVEGNRVVSGIAYHVDSREASVNIAYLASLKPGEGKLWINRMEKYAREKGIGALNLNSVPLAISFYEKMGFVKEGKQVWGMTPMVKILSSKAAGVEDDFVDVGVLACTPEVYAKLFKKGVVYLE